jgi:hypothetical protein
LARAAGTIGPIQALRTKAGEKVSVQFAVRGGRVIGDRDKILLNSEADFRDSRNFTVVVERSADTEAELLARLLSIRHACSRQP